jgi:23S rRNA (uridine2552-2'-O)-methyltransferase
MTFKVKDHYFKKAKKDNYYARSAYKLDEIDQKFKILKKGDQVIDCGYYPGSWIQYTSKTIGSKGTVIGIDIQPVNEKLELLGNVKVLEKDIFTVDDVADVTGSDKFDIFLSDMAPNTTGIKSIDQLKSLELVEKIFEILPKFLRPGGSLVLKIFESQNAQDFFKTRKNNFNEVKYYRPKSTRSTSKEYFFIGKGFVPNDL